MFPWANLYRRRARFLYTPCSLACKKAARCGAAYRCAAAPPCPHAPIISSQLHISTLDRLLSIQTPRAGNVLATISPFHLTGGIRGRLAMYNHASPLSPPSREVFHEVWKSVILPLTTAQSPSSLPRQRQDNIVRRPNFAHHAPTPRCSLRMATCRVALLWLPVHSSPHVCVSVACRAMSAHALGHFNLQQNQHSG